jgi:hypothetical protein
LRDEKRRLANLANNNLAPCQVLRASCKQHPFGVAPAAGL